MSQQQQQQTNDPEDHDERKQDDAKAMRRNSRRAVIFDEDNLRQNKEWHDAHPVTKHIDEPKTPYHTDEGEYVDEDDKEQLAQLEREQAHIEHQTRENTQKNKLIGVAGGDDGNNISQNKNSSRQENASDGWTDAAYNKIGSEALRNQPLTFTSVAPSTSNNSKQNNEDSAAPAVVMPERRVRDDENSSNTKKKPIGLKLNEFSEAQQEEAEKARHDAEFKTMRKAVYRDEGMKFREMLKAAQNAQDDEDEEVDQD